MTWPLWFGDLLFWSVQVAVLALAAGILARILRIREPRALLVCWRTLIGASLLLPFVEPWQRPEVFTLAPAARDISIPTSVIPTMDVAASPWHLPDKAMIAEILSAVVVAGIVVRFVMLVMGLAKLRQLRRQSAAIGSDALCAARLRETRALAGCDAEFRLSGEVDSPVTFGFTRPVVLLPDKFLQVDSPFQAAIACHELLHVRRRDWAHHLGEEVLRAIFWFHPAILWLVAQVRLAREQVVDLEVVRLTAARKTYVEALLEFTSGRKVAAIPAPLFLAEQQLVERVGLMLKEAGMSRRRLIASLSAIACVVTGAGVLGASIFPLKAAPRLVAGVQEETQGVPRGAAPILRSIEVKPRGFDSETLNDTTVQEQKEYLERFLKDAPRVETRFDQKKVDEMERLIVSFWKEKGVDVEVSSALTPIPDTGSARLTFDVQRAPRSAVSRGTMEEGRSTPSTTDIEPIVSAKTISVETVKRGDLSFVVRSTGTLVPMGGKLTARVLVGNVDNQVREVQIGQRAEVEIRGGVLHLLGKVSDLGETDQNGNRWVNIALDSELPPSVGANSSVVGLIAVGKLENVAYISTPAGGWVMTDVEEPLFKIVDNGKAAVRVEVVYGRKGANTVQVLSGLNVGDKVILSDMFPYNQFSRVEIKQSANASGASFSPVSDSDTPLAGKGGYGTPTCVYCPDPQYSDDAYRQKIQGKIVLDTVVGTDGRAHQIRVAHGLGHGLDEQAIHSVHDVWRFKPAKGPDGKPAAVRMLIDVDFHLY